MSNPHNFCREQPLPFLEPASQAWFGLYINGRLEHVIQWSHAHAPKPLDFPIARFCSWERYDVVLVDVMPHPRFSNRTRHA